MTTAVLAPSRTAVVNLERDCLDADCAALADRFHAQLGVPKYSRGVSILPMPPTVEAWRAGHRTARKRADRAARLGYQFDELTDRRPYADDIHAINVSAPQRQGRPMSDGYLHPLTYSPLPAYPCHRHKVNLYGVFHGETMVAYLNAYRCGDLLLVSMILGHADHLPNDVMYLLFQGVVADQAEQGGVGFYNQWSSGTDGLRYFKTKLGFFDGDIEWVL